LADELFQRAFALNLGGTRIAAATTAGQSTELLKCVFKIEASLSKSPNTAEISVYNLTETTRARLSEDDIEVELEAGYIGLISLIFKGEVEAGVSAKDGPDWVTSFQTTDKGKALRSARINTSFKKTKAAEAFKKAAESLGVGLGNALSKIGEGNIRGALDGFSNGLVMSGPAQKEIDRLAKTLGYDWSIQNGQLQLLGPSDAIEPNDAIALDSDRGMIGSPQAGDKGIVEVRALLNPHLTPGRVVALSSLQTSGFFRIEKTTYIGDTRGRDWYADLELKPR
jgi:hypothetical protein